MKYRVVHKTAYRYSEPASLSQNELFLNRRETLARRVIDCRLTISPEPTSPWPGGGTTGTSPR